MRKIKIVIELILLIYPTYVLVVNIPLLVINTVSATILVFIDGVIFGLHRKNKQQT